MKRLVLLVVIGAVASMLYLALTRSPADVARLETASESASTDAAGAELVTSEPLGARSERTDAVSDASQATANTELVIEVVDARTEQPIVGARVFVEREDVDEFERRAAEERYGFSGPLLAPVLGREFAADRDGRVRVPSPKCPVTIWASHEELHGEVDVSTGAANARVELVTLRGVTVAVVDRLGVPAANVNVALLGLVLGEWDVQADALTDEHGRVELYGLEEAAPEETAPLRIATPLVGCSPDFVEFTRANAPSEPVRLVIADTGVVDAVATDARGEPLSIAARMDLSVDERADSPMSFVVAVRDGQSACTRDGHARFERIGLGLSLRVDAYFEGLSFTERIVPGPRVADEVVRVAVPLAEAHPIIRAQLVATDGSAFANRRVRISGVNLEGQRQALFDECRTDAEGRLQLCKSLKWSFPERLLEVDVDVVEPGMRVARARTTWPPAREVRDIVPRQEHDFGALVCVTDPFFCSGRVVDASGAPVDGAEVGGRWRTASGDTAWAVTTLANSHGEFELGIPDEIGELEVTAISRNGREPAPFHPAARGVTGIVLVLPAERESGTLRGQFVWPEGLDSSDIQLALDPADGGRRRWANWDENESGPFEAFTGFVGRSSLVVLFQDEVVARVDGIEVRAGEITELAPIDLRERIHALRFEVVDERGAALGGGTVCELRGEEYVNHVTVASDGRAVLPSLGTTIDVVASAPGRSSRLFRGVASGAKLELGPGATAVIRAPSLGDAGAEFALAVELAYCDDDLALAFSDDLAVVFAEHDRVSVAAPGLGDYCVRSALLVHRTSGARFELEFAPTDQPIVTLVAAPAESSLSLPADALADALARATKQ
ncbi:MAG: carboxypeptidase regulatory-like domain-containing protein [Planctomycetes bacterium]|nr:carboxypeptidase regulatory-like domain-containing protein [Planctomycetota bacterium]